MRYLVLTVFLVYSAYLLRKNRVYAVPLILIVYSNLNGLLDWEDFALRGLIKFQDYGLIATIILILDDWLMRRGSVTSYEALARRSLLYKAVLLFWGYYLFVFVYSIALHQGVEWPIKMGRVFFYGLVFFVAWRMLKPDPLHRFDAVILILKRWMIWFGCLYVAYNVVGWEIYPKAAHEDFENLGLEGVRRNFSGLPIFAGYFAILCTHNFIEGKPGKLGNLFGAVLMVLCQALSLTRGFVLLTLAAITLTVLCRRFSLAGLSRVLFLVIGTAISAYLAVAFAPSYYEVLALRFDELIDAGGATQAANYVVRADEFFRILANVVDFNPLFGFGFTNIAELHLGYASSVVHGGSADNGFSNLIGTTGFLGVLIFLGMILLWINTNVRLQLTRAEPYAKVHLVFIFYMIASFLNGASMSYMHAFALFLAYDILAYSKIMHERRACLDNRQNVLRFPAMLPSN